ncbi:melatonin receptor type 1B-like [Exaiptasia diaphana]|nr:melatonin receptor type 1B-like [Exaiptasia diaphana]
MNSSAPSHDPLGRTATLVAIETTLAIIITLSSLLGNSMLIYVLHRDPRLRSITNVFIESLAWSDVSMATLKMPFWVLSVSKGRWVLSQNFCPWSAAFMLTFGVCSILTMGLIAINRYFKVVRNTIYGKYFKNRRYAIGYCLVMWIAAMMLATPPLYGWGSMQYHVYFSVCTVVWDMENISYALVVVGGAVGGTAVAIFACYYSIYKKVKSTTANINAYNPSTNHLHDIRILKSTFAVVCFFLFTWIPVSCVVVIDTVGIEVPRVVFVSVIYLMFTSSCGNPFIYGILSPQFRRAFISAIKFRPFANNHDHTNDIISVVTRPMQVVPRNE